MLEKQNTPNILRFSELIHTNIGQGEGEGDAKWKGCAWKELLFSIFILY